MFEALLKTSNIFSLKLLLFFWITFCVFNTFFYASMIKASLTSPAMTSPIANLKEIVDSGLPYKLLFIDEVEEASWRKSSNPNIRHIFQKKKNTK